MEKKRYDESYFINISTKKNLYSKHSRAGVGNRSLLPNVLGNIDSQLRDSSSLYSSIGNDSIFQRSLNSSSFDLASPRFLNQRHLKVNKDASYLNKLNPSISLDSFNSISPRNENMNLNANSSLLSSLMSKITQKRSETNRRENIALLARLELATERNNKLKKKFSETADK